MTHAHPPARPGRRTAAVLLAVMPWLFACTSSRFVENAEGDVFPPPFCEFDVSFPEIPRYSMERLDGEPYPRGTIETELYLLRAECAPRVNPDTTAEILAQGYASQYPNAVVETVQTPAGTTWHVTGSLQVGESTVRDEYHIVQGDRSIMVVQTAGTEPRYPVREVRNFIASLRLLGEDAPEFTAVDVAEDDTAAPAAPPTRPLDEAGEWSGPAPRPVEPTAPAGLVVRPLDEAAAEEEAAGDVAADLPGPPAPLPETAAPAAPAALPPAPSGPISAARPQPLGPTEWAAQAPGGRSPTRPHAGGCPGGCRAGAAAAGRSARRAIRLAEAPAGAGAAGGRPPPVAPSAAVPRPALDLPAPPAPAVPVTAVPVTAAGTPTPVIAIPAAPPSSPPAPPADGASPPAAAAVPGGCAWVGRSVDASVPNLQVSDGRLAFLGDGSRPAGTLMGARAALLMVGDESHLLRIERDGIAYGSPAAAAAAQAGLRAGQAIAIRVTGHDVSQVYRFDGGAFDASGAGCAPADQGG
ncbi:MAG: hypothetical protein H6842_13080 [Rhodospirillaceae bacterium]|nr:hypothetical protein [Rhodospirillaceae bacterium]